MTPINKTKEENSAGEKVDSIRASLACFPPRDATFEVIENLCHSTREREP